VYYYEYVLPTPFNQVQGTTYWISIIPMPNNPQLPPVWRWQEANRWYNPVNCGAAYLDAFGNWQTITWPTGAMIKFSDLAFSITSMPDKTLDLKLYLEGLYPGGGLMNKAQDEFGDHFTGDIADLITIELHDAANYLNILYTATNVELHQYGQSTVSGIPYFLSGSYYVTVKHRNSIETTTANPLSFAGSVVNYDFTTAASQAYGSNQKFKVDAYVIYGGDVNLDGLVDSSDMIAIDNDASTFSVGYISTDVNGDGLVDSGDMILVDNNANNFIGALLP
jgi:hypothetical protein